MKFLNAITLMSLAAVLILNYVAADEAAYQEGDEEATALSMMPSDQEETKGLTADTQVFGDYCIESRDEVKKFLSELTHGAAATVFDAFFGTLGEFTADLVHAEQGAVEKGAELIRQKVVSEPSEGVIPKQEIKENLSQSVENLSLIQQVSEAVKAVISTVIEAAQSQIFQRIALLRASFDAETLKEKLTEACDLVGTKLQKRLMTKFNASKRELSSGTKDRSIAEAINKTKFDTLKCVSTGRIVKVARVCDFLRVAGPTIYPLLGM